MKNLNGLVKRRLDAICNEINVELEHPVSCFTIGNLTISNSAHINKTSLKTNLKMMSSGFLFPAMYFLQSQL